MTLELKNNSELLESKGETTWWRWTAYINGPETELEKIKYVEYQLHSSFKNPIKRIRKRESGFPLTMKGWGTFVLRARIVFKDPATQAALLSHELKFQQQHREYENT